MGVLGQLGSQIMMRMTLWDPDCPLCRFTQDIHLSSNYVCFQRGSASLEFVVYRLLLEALWIQSRV